MADNQITEKALAFIDGMQLRERVIFAVDPGSTAIDALGIRRENPEPIEMGVPHPATYVIDRTGLIRFVDTREDYQLWLDPEVAIAALGQVR